MYMPVDTSMPECEILHRYQNGNAEITIFEDGTSVIETPEDQDFLDLEYPLNIDVRVSTYCSFGKKKGKSSDTAVCSFCHESASQDGVECDYEKLKEKLMKFPDGLELAVGCNELTAGLEQFIKDVGSKFIVNLTINQGHIHRFADRVLKLVADRKVWGIGISYRPSLEWKVPKEIVDYPNTILHCIVGIDSVKDVLALRKKGVKKILLLGEKDFGFNEGKVDTKSKSHMDWRFALPIVLSKFPVVCFDNLALEQLPVQKLISPEDWGVIYRGEHSFYIDAVNGWYKRSSRVAPFVEWDAMSAPTYFKMEVKC
jgi:hypothetical protein